MPIAPGTIALYRFENDLTDSSGNSYTMGQVGTIPVNNTTPATIPQGTYAAGVFTDAQYGTLPAGLRTALSGLATYTIQLYVHPLAIAGTPLVFSGTGSGTLTNFQILASGAAAFNTGAAFLVTGAGACPINTWTHVAFTYDGTNRRIWINGSNVASDTAAGTLQAGITAFFIGRYQAAGGYPFNGYIDQLRFSTTLETVFPTVDTTATIDLGAGSSALNQRMRRYGRGW